LEADPYVPLLIRVWVDEDTEVAVVHHAHHIPGDDSGLGVHGLIPGTQEKLPDRTGGGENRAAGRLRREGEMGELTF
jgi:hypothetical protein